MPFTPAHVAAVLPVMGRRRPRWCVPSALAIGAMVPDALYFLPVRGDRAFSHSLTGIVTLDLALGVVCLALWWWGMAPVLRDLAPAWVRTRAQPATRPTGHTWLWAVPCLLLGEVTHIVWDSFTHADGWAVLRWAWLGQDGPVGLPWFKWAQYGSGVFGSVAVAWWLVRRLRELPPVRESGSHSTLAQRRVAWAVMTGMPLLAGAWFAIAAALDRATTEMLLYVAVVRGISAFGLAAIIIVIWWHADRRHEPATVAARNRDAR